MIVDNKTFPAVFAAFTAIDYDSGMVNRLEPARTEYEVPERWGSTLDVAQSYLQRLDGALNELETFCNGESSEQLELAQRYRIPDSVSALLNAYFDGWEESGEEK